MTVTAYIIGPAHRAPMRVGIAYDVEVRRQELSEMIRQDLRLHDFVVTTDAEAAQIIAITHDALKANHLAGEAFDVSPVQAMQAFRDAVQAVKDLA